MKIYTGYFAKKAKYEENDLVVVSIARYTPDWVGEVGKETLLAPSEKLLSKYKKGYIDEKEYMRVYNDEVLSKISQDELYEHLHSKYAGSDIVLCCFEARGKFCHRHVLAKWLNEKGYAVEEFVC